MRPIICLTGPTASGKTELAIELSQRFPLVIISADSALVYKGLDKGTAKPTREQLILAPHRLIDVCDPSQPYSTGDFYKQAYQEIEKIHAQNRIPFIVGGTLLYYWTLQQGLADLPIADPSLRQEISEKAAQLGWEALHQELQKIDPHSAKKIRPQDKQRIQRALEVYHLTGEPISALHHKASNVLNYQFHHIILTAHHRPFLHERVAHRLEKFFRDGLVEEVATLRQRADIHAALPAMRLVGYRQTWEYLDGQYDFPTLKQKAYYATCQLIKRQYTWLRRFETALQIYIDESPINKESIYTFLDKKLK